MDKDLFREPLAVIEGLDEIDSDGQLVGFDFSLKDTKQFATDI